MTLTPEHREKLRKLVTLANFLDDLPHRRFMQGQWSDTNATMDSCGTAACIAGWTATLFRKDWFFLPPFYVPRLRSHSALVPDSMSHYFGLALAEAKEMVSPVAFRDFCYTRGIEKSPQAAAQFIRSFIAKYDPTLLEEERGKPEGAAELLVAH